MQKILMRIDFQNDFVHPEGALSLRDINLIRKHQILANSATINQFDKVIDTYDTHFENTYQNTTESEKFPLHCVYGSWGWQQAAPFPDNVNVVPMYKSTTNIWNETAQYRELQDDWSDKIVYLCGVLSDVCVQQALNGLLQHNAHVIIIEDLCKGAKTQIADLFKLPEYQPYIEKGMLTKIQVDRLYRIGRTPVRLPQPINEKGG